MSGLQPEITTQCLAHRIQLIMSRTEKKRRYILSEYIESLPPNVRDYAAVLIRSAFSIAYAISDYSYANAIVSQYSNSSALARWLGGYSATISSVIAWSFEGNAVRHIVGTAEGHGHCDHGNAHEHDYKPISPVKTALYYAIFCAISTGAVMRSMAIMNLDFASMVAYVKSIDEDESEVITALPHWGLALLNALWFYGVLPFYAAAELSHFSSEIESRINSMTWFHAGKRVNPHKMHVQLCHKLFGWYFRQSWAVDLHVKLGWFLHTIFHVPEIVMTVAPMNKLKALSTVGLVFALTGVAGLTSVSLLAAGFSTWCFTGKEARHALQDFADLNKAQLDGQTNGDHDHILSLPAHHTPSAESEAIKTFLSKKYQFSHRMGNIIYHMLSLNALIHGVDAFFGVDQNARDKDWSDGNHYGQAIFVLAAIFIGNMFSEVAVSQNDVHQLTAPPKHKNQISNQNSQFAFLDTENGSSNKEYAQDFTSCWNTCAADLAL